MKEPDCKNPNGHHWFTARFYQTTEAVFIWWLFGKVNYSIHEEKCTHCKKKRSTKQNLDNPLEKAKITYS